MVLYKGAKIVSIAHIEFLANKIAVLRKLATDESYKKYGYGTYLLNMVEKWIKSKERNIIKLHSNPKAVGFYKKLGYVEMDFTEVDYLNKDLVNMGKMLG